LRSVRIKSSPFVVCVAINHAPPQFGQLGFRPRYFFDLSLFIFTVTHIEGDRDCRARPHDAAGRQLYIFAGRDVGAFVDGVQQIFEIIRREKSYYVAVLDKTNEVRGHWKLSEVCL
jgi:hypothetical protein